MKKYEVAMLTIPMGSNAAVYPRIQEYVSAPEAGGRLLAVWYSDIGELNQLMVVREFDDSAELDRERERLLVGGNPFGIGDMLARMTLDTYAAFPFLPPVQTGEQGPFYEVRVYGIKPNGLAPTIEAWRNAIDARNQVSPLLIAMYALDGVTPRFMNIWGYPSMDARTRARAEAVGSGVWPPKGGPAHLTTLQSSFFLPAPISPLR